MKKSLQCPKCEGRVIVHVKQVALPIARPGFRGDAFQLPIVVRKSGFGPKPFGGFETFVCKACGFTEWYALDLDRLDPAQDPDIRIIDNEPKATLR